MTSEWLIHNWSENSFNLQEMGKTWDFLKIELEFLRTTFTFSNELFKLRDLSFQKKCSYFPWFSSTIENLFFNKLKVLKVLSKFPQQA